MKRIIKKLKQYLGNYRFNSLFFKNLYMLLLLIMVPIIGASLIGYYAYENMRRKEIEAYSEGIASNVLTKFNGILEETRTELIYFGINSNVELYLIDNDLKQYYYKVRTIQELIMMPQLVKDYVESVYIYSRNSGYVLWIEGVEKYDTFPHRGILESYMNRNDRERNFLITETVEERSQRKYFSVFYDIDYGKNMKGIAAMNMDVNAVMEKLEIPEEAECYILDQGEIILASDDSFLQKAASDIPWYNGLGNSVVRDGHYILSTYDSASGVEIMLRLDMSSYRDELSGVRIFILVLLAVVVWITIVLALVISVRLFQPIEKIVASIQQHSAVLTGETEGFLEKDELEYILQTIQKSVKARKNVDEELAERIYLLKKAQSVALQAQINPHFINNTLEAMNWEAIDRLGRKNEISDMAGALSKMLRMTLESTDAIVPIRTEIDHCKTYLEIQMKRYEGKFDVIWDIAEEVYDCKIIRIVLQPLVENSIYHGIKPLSNKGRISIKGSATEEYVELSVADNGLGMSKEELEKLQHVMKSEEIKECLHIGVANVNQRLKLYFGEKYGLLIESEEGIGTSVTIRVPKI